MRCDLATDRGQVIFFLMAEKKWHIFAEIIANQGEEINTQEDDYFPNMPSRLLHVAYSGRSDEIINHSVQGLDLSDSESFIESMALFVSIERRHIPIARSLVEASVNVHAKDIMGQFALHRAP